MTHTPTDFFKTANRTSEHFGFSTIEQLKKIPACKTCPHKTAHTVTVSNKRIDAQQGLLASGIATYCDEKLHALEKPVFLYRTEQVPRSGEAAVTFHIFGVPQSIAESLLIQAARSLLTELGHKEHVVRINSLGCNESVTRYTRELTNFLRRRIDHMSPTAREIMKEHPLLALKQLIAEEHDLSYRSPSPLEHLNETSRKHFREIIEFLDVSETPYEIDPRMLEHHECYSDAIFSLDVETDGQPAPISARGGRFNEFVSRNTDIKIPAVGLVVTLCNSKAPARMPRHKYTNPSVYLVQLGLGPKVRSLLLIDQLRQSGIPVYHDLASNSLSEQLRDAEERQSKYVVIVGQKEFIEGTVILRNMSARTQEFVPQHELTRKLKRRKDVVTV